MSKKNLLHPNTQTTSGLTRACYLLARRTLLMAGIFLAAILSSSVVAAETSRANLQFIHLLTEQGYSVGSVESLQQDHQGYMWFGGLDGLVQFDGYNFTSYRNKAGDDTSLSSNVVWDIYEDRQGIIWIATDGGLNRFNRDQGNFTRYQHAEDDPTSINSNFARSIAEDSEGNLWIATFVGLARLDPQREIFTRYLHNPEDEHSLSSNELRKVFVDRSNRLWIGTDKRGLNRLDISSGKFHRYPWHRSDSTGTSRGTVVSLFEDRDGYIWLGTDGGGINRLDPNTGAFGYFNYTPGSAEGLSHNTVMDIAEDAKGNLWLATEGGLNLLDRQTLQFSRHVHNPNERNSLSSSVVRSLFVDSNQDLWVGNFPTGVNFLDTSNMAFKTYRHDPNNKNSLSHASVLAIEEDLQGNLWLGTDGGGLNRFDRETGQFTHYLHNPDDPQSISAPAVVGIERDHDERFWLGTWRGGANHFDPATGKAKTYTTSLQDPGAISSENVWSVYRDQQNNLWFATVGGGLSRFNRATEKFVHYQNQYPSGLPVHVFWTVYQDHLGQIWAGTGEGLGRYVPEEDHFVFYQHDPGNPDSLSFNVVLDIAEDKRNRLWLATRGGGLNMFDRKTGKFTHFTEQNGLHNDVITSIEPDDQGNFWLGSSNGLSRFNPRSHEFINYNEKNGLQGNQFNIGAALKTRTGEIVVGGTDGFTLFDPAALTLNQHIPQVAIIDFQIFNKPVVVGAEGSPLTKVISQTDSITLTHRQSVFSFSFVAMSYRNTEKNQFAYMLEGFEQEWNFVNSDRRNATYTNLNPGTYVFKVKAANNQGVWNETGRSITLHILPPPWKTWWAYAFYCLVIIGLLLAFVRAQHTKVLNERKINRRLQQLDKLKDEFLANTSHELRTPLNGIIGLAESLVDGVGGQQSDISQANLAMIVSSGKRLERLVNAILDFSKLKEHSLTLYSRPVDMHALTHVVLALSQPAVATRNLQLINAISKNAPLVHADEDRVQQIMHNLIGNAVKFTRSGTITVSATRLDNQLEIQVRDSGIGIAAAELPHIFDSFHQVEGAVDRHYSGTGLGLAVTKQLVELHGGQIRVESIPGRGSRFCFTLPLSSEIDTRQIANEPESRIVDVEFGSEDSTEVSTMEMPVQESMEKPAHRKQILHKENAHFHILIVDDELVNRQVLLNHLSLQHYRVTPAATGKEALDIIASQHIDLVLLDVMMPSMSGYEVCKQLRQKFPSHELPIIFLTAKSQINDLITGFSLGANDFLTKPVSRDELLARVDTHLKLLEITRDLETKVEERTAELQHKHEELEQAYVQLEAISLSDPLTGLSNRRYLQKLIPMDIAKVQREYDNLLHNRTTKNPAHDLAFFLLDVDFFKPVNDLYGHMAGDQLLIQISELLTKVCRESDCLVRWGGEEFLIVSRFSNREEAPLMAERIRISVAEHAFELSDGTVLHKTCSIGFACYPFRCEQPLALSWEQVIDTADRALYAAKKSGRNRSVGLAASDTTPSNNLYQKISEDVNSMIDNNELVVISQEGDELIWD